MQLPHNKSRLIIALEYLANKLNRLNKCSYRRKKKKIIIMNQRFLKNNFSPKWQIANGKWYGKG
jgi:hypothetical protein